MLMARAITFYGDKICINQTQRLFPSCVCLQTSLKRGMLLFLKYSNLGNSVEPQSTLFFSDNNSIPTDQYYVVATNHISLLGT